MYIKLIDLSFESDTHPQSSILDPSGLRGTACEKRTKTFQNSEPSHFNPHLPFSMAFNCCYFTLPGPHHPVASANTPCNDCVVSTINLSTILKVISISSGV